MPFGTEPSDVWKDIKFLLFTAIRGGGSGGIRSNGKMDKEFCDEVENLKDGGVFRHLIREHGLISDNLEALKQIGFNVGNIWFIHLHEEYHNSPTKYCTTHPHPFPERNIQN